LRFTVHNDKNRLLIQPPVIQKQEEIMTNIMEFQKFCEWCHQPFASQKMTTRYCSHACNSKAYKANKREEAKKQYNMVAINFM
jgi:hypothetical protein